MQDAGTRNLLKDHAFINSYLMTIQKFPHKISPQQLGQAVEDLAVSHLKKQGFAIKARNYRYQCAEVDIIAKKITFYYL